jgi:hypothetical protein
LARGLSAWRVLLRSPNAAARRAPMRSFTTASARFCTFAPAQRRASTHSREPLGVIKPVRRSANHVLACGHAHGKDGLEQRVTIDSIVRTRPGQASLGRWILRCGTGPCRHSPSRTLSAFRQLLGGAASLRLRRLASDAVCAFPMGTKRCGARERTTALRTGEVGRRSGVRVCAARPSPTRCPCGTRLSSRSRHFVFPSLCATQAHEHTHSKLSARPTMTSQDDETKRVSGALTVWLLA